MDWIHSVFLFSENARTTSIIEYGLLTEIEATNYHAGK